MTFGISSIFLSAQTPELFIKTQDFYQHLQLKVIARFDDQVDMHLFTPRSTPLILSIKLNPDQEIKQPSADIDSLDKMMINRFLSLSISNLAEITESLKSVCVSFVNQLPSSKSPETIWLTDPLGNVISIQEKKTLLSDPIEEPDLPSNPIHILSSDKTIPSNASNTSLASILKTKHNIGILTSGGDSSGMNAAVRAIARCSIQSSCRPFAIFEGYNGLVEGGDKIKELGWEDVRGLLSMGGTVLGTARSQSFRTREGRLQSALNLINNNIDSLVVIGGDGSLTGADLLRSEWPSLIAELQETGKIRTGIEDSIKHLTIVGLVGSIDNDMSLTDITIGAVTSLHRICESLDSLTSTALSHQRAFVVEVMGRHCGWLALMAAIAVWTEFKNNRLVLIGFSFRYHIILMIIKERPPPLSPLYGDDWEDEMCQALSKQKGLGSRALLVIVAEGAIDKQLNSIKSEKVKNVIESRLGLDTRVTTLGHVQRGGKPCAYDRCLATVQGAQAVRAVMASTPETPSPMIGISQNKITSVPLVEAVKVTASVAAAIQKKDFKAAMELRDPDFNAAYTAYIESTFLATGSAKHLLPDDEKLTIGIMHMGAPAGGMNAATRVAARLCLNRGHIPLGISNGFSGLLRDEVASISWQRVTNWQTKGGSELGTNRDHPKPWMTGPKIDDHIKEYVDLGQIAFHLQKHNIQALLVIGGFEAFTAIDTLHCARTHYPAFCIPMVHLPATISNNVPGTDFSIGTDTALNVIVEACDGIKLSANASRSRVFVVEVQGGILYIIFKKDNAGKSIQSNKRYLAAMSGLICGASSTYIPEEGITIDRLQSDIKYLCKRYEEERRLKIPHEGRIILRTETAGGDVYTTAVVSSILKAEGKGLFDSRTTILGHLQQGSIPSPLDRIRATRTAVNCIDWIQESATRSRKAYKLSTGKDIVYTESKDDCCVIGIRGAKTVITPIQDLILETDLEKRRGTTAWWWKLQDLTKILSKHELSL